MLFVLKKEEIGYLQELAQAQLILDKEKGLERFLEYQKQRFPWVETAKTREKDLHKKILEDVVKRGPILVTAENKKPGIRSRMVQHTQKKMTPEERHKQNEFYKKLGKVIPT